MGYTFDLLRRFYEYHHGYIRLHTLPLIAEVEPTNICNLNCGFCHRKGIGERGFGMMELYYFKALVGLLHKQMVHTRLFLHGESVLNPNLVDMVQFLNHYRNNNVRSIGFTSNGTLLNADLFKQLVNAGLDNLEFSFEGPDKETFEFLRKGAKYEIVKQNILDACRINYSLGCPVNIGINIIDCKQTHSKLQSFIDEWKDTPGLNRVDVGVLGDWAGTFNVDEYKISDSEFMPICMAPWFTCTIDWRGDVRPCCKWTHKPFGNIFRPQAVPKTWLQKHLPWDNFRGDTGLAETWNGVAFQELRRAMLKGRQNHPYCKNCKSDLFSKGSPYLVNPNRLYPFSKSFLNQIRIYRSISEDKKYIPLKEKQKYEQKN